jgi:hypothetical protein
MLTDFNAVPDSPETRLVLAPPPEGSVAPELVQQFIRENHIPLWNERQCIYELSRISINKWAMISTFLSTTCKNKFDGGTIHTLSRMSVDLLALVIDFAMQRNITNREVLFALSNVKVEEFNPFIQLAEAHDLLQKPKIWRALAAMPAQYRENFIHFCKAKQYDINGLKGGLIFQQHTPEFWPEIDNFLKEVNVSDYVLKRLAEIPAIACLDYMRFISANQVDDWDDKSILVDIVQSLRQTLWDFVCKYGLSIAAFKKISEDMWPRVSIFIERHVRPDNIQLSEYTIDALIKVSDEDWPEFNYFLDAHQIHEFGMIANYAKMSSLQRHYLFDFIQKYQLKSFEISTFSRISVEDWPSFIALIEENELTNVKQLSAIARRTPEEWAACANLIVRRNISDFYSLINLERISSQHFHFLCAFVDEYNIDDEHVIYGLSQIPSVRQWVSIYTLAQPLFAPPLSEEKRGCVMHALYEITKQEYRVDRVMPIYDDNERLARIAVVQDRIERGLMSQNPIEYYEQMQQILRTPANQLGNMHQAARANARTINVHADGREDGTGHALQQLVALPYDTSQIDNDYAALIAYLNDFPGDFTRTSAQFVLGVASSQAEGFAPLSADTMITNYGLNITGKEFLARCWNYIQNGEFIGVTDSEALARDRENARVSLIRNLADAYEDGAVVCNPGKLQHIAVGILQGRLESVHIDCEIPIVVQSTPAEIPADNTVNATLVRNTVASSLRYFLLQYEATVASQAQLKSYVDHWLQAERGLSGETYQKYREDFRKELDDYLSLSELPETDVDMVNDTHNQLTSETEFGEEKPQQLIEYSAVSLDEGNADDLRNAQCKIVGEVSSTEAFAGNSSDSARERMAAELLPRRRYLPMKQARRENILGIERGLLQELLKRVTPTSEFIELPPKVAELYEKRRKAITKTIKTANQFCIEVGNFIPSNPLKKPEVLNDETLYLACICSRVHAALKFLSNENNAHKYNNHCFVVGEKYEAVEDVDILKFNPCKQEFEEVIYNIDYHQQNLQEVQKMISNLSGHHWESVRNTAFALVAALVVASIAVGLTVGTSGIILPVLLSAATLSAGIGFFAAQDTGIAKSARQLELNAIEFPCLKQS